MEIEIFDGFAGVLREVGFALIPLLIFFLFFQLWLLKLPWRRVLQILTGVAFAFLGLALFLQGVHVGFLPVGQEVGHIVGEWDRKWILIPVGFLLGFVATFAEPAVNVLNHEVDKVSGGYIPKRLMLWTLSVGVALSIALSMARILYGIPILSLIIPGYLLAMVMMYYSNEKFTAIAFDAGGVATGPMTVTFILAIALGLAESLEGRDPLLDGFGMIALVALSPILTVLGLGLLYRWKEAGYSDRVPKE